MGHPAREHRSWRRGSTHLKSWRAHARCAACRPYGLGLNIARLPSTYLLGFPLPPPRGWFLSDACLCLRATPGRQITCQICIAHYLVQEIRRGFVHGEVESRLRMLLCKWIGFAAGEMEYLIGLILSLAVAGFATAVGFDRERVFYPTVLIVIASYYVLFAAEGASARALMIEIAIASCFLIAAALGFKKSFWIMPVALAGHGVFDFFHRFFIDNPGVPRWWPGFCLAFDVVLAVWLTVRLGKHSIAR